MSENTRTSQVALRTIFYGILQVGLTAYGMAILQKLWTRVIEQGWLTESEVEKGLACTHVATGASCSASCRSPSASRSVRKTRPNG